MGTIILKLMKNVLSEEFTPVQYQVIPTWGNMLIQQYSSNTGHVQSVKKKPQTSKIFAVASCHD